MIDFVELGIRIARAREKKHLTQDELADMVQTGGKYISAIERGVSHPSLGMLYEICCKLDISLDYTVGGVMLSSHIPSDFNIIFEGLNEKQIEEVRGLISVMYRNNNR